MDNIAETLTFTVINPDNVEEENQVQIDINAEDKTFKVNNIPIDGQQLAELGMLLFSLAVQYKAVDDVDSCGELLDGFEIPVPKKELQELING